MKTAPKEGLLLILLLLLPLPIFSVAPNHVRYRNNPSSEWTSTFDTSNAEEGSIEVAFSEDGENWTGPVSTTVLVETTRDDYFSAIWKWEYEGTADSFCFSINGGNIETVEGNERSVTSEILQYNELHILELQACCNNILSDPVNCALIVIRRKPDNGFMLRLSLSPYLLRIVDFYNGHDIPDARYLTLSAYGFSADLDAGYCFNRFLQAYTGLGYSLVLRNETILPDAIPVNYFKLVAGLDCMFLHVNDFSMGSGIFGGGMLSINGNYYNFSPVFGARILADWKLNEILTVGITSRISFIPHISSSSPLYDNMTYLIDAIAVSLGARF